MLILEGIVKPKVLNTLILGAFVPLVPHTCCTRDVYHGDPRQGRG